jgi:hypothetical protein
MDVAEPDDRHRIEELLHLRGTVHHDPDGGLQFGKKRFSIEWTALVSLRIQGDRLQGLSIAMEALSD